MATRQRTSATRRRRATPESAPPPPAPEPAAVPAEPERTAEELLVLHLTHREQGKLHYEQSDLFFNQLLALVRKTRRSKKIKHPTTGEVFQIVDNFKTTNIAWGHGSVRRWDLKAVKGTKKPKVAPEANGAAHE